MAWLVFMAWLAVGLVALAVAWAHRPAVRLSECEWSRSVCVGPGGAVEGWRWGQYGFECQRKWLGKLTGWAVGWLALAALIFVVF